MRLKSTIYLSCTLAVFASTLSISAQTPAQSTSVTSVPSWFTRCSGENTPCAVAGPAQVIFGTSNGFAPAVGGHFLMQTVNGGSLLCAGQTFGDADPGHAKSCWYGPVPGLPQGKIANAGGSDYPFYVQNDESWDNNQRVVVGQYNLNPGLVQAQLQQMYKTGQRDVSLVIWYMPFGTSNTPVDGVQDAAFLDSSGGHLSTTTQQNLVSILKLINQIGFRQVTLRFAPIGLASPQNWASTWNESTFQQDEALVFSTRQIAETTMASSSVARVYDLGVEMGGIQHVLDADGVTYADGQTHEWTTRLWGDYVKAYGKGDSYGFSIPYAPGALTQAIAEYDQAGTRPNSYAIDDYSTNDLWNVYQELFKANEVAKPIVMQETSYDDPVQMQGFTNALQHIPLTIAYIDQWPASTSVANANASPPTGYSAYGGSSGTTGTIVVQPCTLQPGQSTCTTTASWSTSNASGTGLYINGVVAPNAPNITVDSTGTSVVTLGLLPTSLVLATTQGTVSATSGFLTAATTLTNQTVLDSATVTAVDPNSPVLALAGLGGAKNQAIWAIGSDISSACTVQLYDPASPASSPLATLTSANCNGNSLSFGIPTAVLNNYSAVNLVVTNPGLHASVPLLVPIQPVPLISIAGLGGPGNQDVWAIGSNFSTGCTVQLSDPKAAAGTTLATITAVSCQPNCLSFGIPSSVAGKYTAVNMTVLDSDGQASQPLLLHLGS